MAFGKSIKQVSLGVSADYWRIVAFHVDVVSKQARLVMGGYVNADIRNANGQFIDAREFVLTIPQFIALVNAAPEGNSVYEVNASAMYKHIASAPRQIPIGAQLMPETGDIFIAATGELIPAAKVTLNEHSEPVWIPSEFEDAEIV